MYFAVFRYFTYYEKEIPEHLKATNSCLLVGWNLRQACFNLEKTCVMMKECRVLDETCKTCQVFNAILKLCCLLATSQLWIVLN